jgi:hypothetical protein
MNGAVPNRASESHVTMSQWRVEDGRTVETKSSIVLYCLESRVSMDLQLAEKRKWGGQQAVAGSCLSMTGWPVSRGFPFVGSWVRSSSVIPRTTAPGRCEIQTHLQTCTQHYLNSEVPAVLVLVHVEDANPNLKFQEHIAHNKKRKNPPVANPVTKSEKIHQLRTPSINERNQIKISFPMIKSNEGGIWICLPKRQRWHMYHTVWWRMIAYDGIKEMKERWHMIAYDASSTVCIFILTTSCMAK